MKRKKYLILKCPLSGDLKFTIVNQVATRKEAVKICDDIEKDDSSLCIVIKIRKLLDITNMRLK